MELSESDHMAFWVAGEERAPGPNITNFSADIHALGGEISMGRVYILNEV